MVRYIFSLVLGIGFLVLGILTVSGVSLWSFYDLPSLIFTVVFPFALLYIVQGNTVFWMAVRAPFKRDIPKEQLVKANVFFTYYSITTWLSGVIAVLIGNIAMMKNLEDKTQLGPNMALAFMSLLYAALIHVLVIIPFKLLIKGKIKE